MKLLNLTLTKHPFDLMERELKRIEFRRESTWIASRLIGKQYTHVKFTNGYGADKPWFIAEFKGVIRMSKMMRISYDAGKLVIWSLPGDFVIFLGDVIERGNIKKRN
ncbi:hypothetical protein MTO98_26700 [Mucilaginibacter sp. SMC90]|uniref:hypothetical protein n=1 Tax=Mucilaginibacter sp. SMC90 TaxID=2929803 RepID=UPI001FB47CB2|nr:hypothetical protein [Mucilaginibacter sp. SMC90]UOE48005.1 hypothetical protein MTO98_26700 [Mucilaginibacter sp. SMC90]